MEKNQVSSTTCYNRHPAIFEECLEIVGDDENKKILSFGCSYGFESLSLKELYFLKSKIDGFDIDKDVIDENKKKETDDLKFYDSLDKLVESSYDLIFCMSVLVRNPDISNSYSFNIFESTLSYIDKYLKVGGYICIWNSRFRFTDAVISCKYTAIKTRHTDSGFNQKYDKFYKKEVNDYKYILFKKII